MSEEKKQGGKGLKSIVKKAGKVIFILSIVFIVYAIWKLGFDVHSITNWPLFLLVTLIGVLVKSFTVFVSGSAWVGWLQFFAKKPIDKIEAICVYTKANIGKYLPGNVMHYVERNLFATNLGISQKKLAVSTILEIIGSVSVAMILSALVSLNQLLNALHEIFGDSYLTIILAAFFAGLFVLVVLIFVLRKKIGAVLKEYTPAEFIKTFLFSLVKYSITLVSLGLIMVALYAYSGGKLSWENGSLIVSGYIIAWVLGFIIPGASGGIGVRELVVTLLLGSVMGKETVLTLSVIHRLITVVGDFLVYLVRIPIQNKHQAKQN